MRRQPYRNFGGVDPYPLISPGFLGLNTELVSAAGNIDGQWALDLREAVFDEFGTISTRKGWENATTTAMTGGPSVTRLFEFLDISGNAKLIGQTTDKLWLSTDDGDSWSDITGSVAFSGVTWKFVNFYGSVVGAAPGYKPIVYTGSGNFAEVTAGSGAVPTTNGTITSAYGRVWVGEDATGAVVYCALLDVTLWATADGAGSIDPSNVWTQGQDEVMGLAAFGANFCIFGKRHILIYVDGAGSTVGIDPDNMYIVDTIEGTGLACRDSIVPVGEGDLLFVSTIGVQSLRRVVSDKNNPLTDVTRWQRSLVKQLVAAETADGRYSVQGIYNPINQFVLYLFPASQRILMLDTRFPMQDGTLRAAEWRSQTHTCLLSRLDGTVLFGRSDGKVATYSSYRDNGTAYALIYGSPWLDGGPQLADRIKHPKRVTFDIVGRETLTVITRWGFDFRGLEYSNTQTNDYVASGSEWALGEWNEAEWSGGIRSRRGYTPMSANGYVFKVWFSITSTDVSERAAIRRLAVFFRTGRYSS